MDLVNKKFYHMVKWRRPRKIALSHDWHVAAGEESEEIKDQRRRERFVCKQVYRHRSDIPPNPPFFSRDLEGGHLHDCQIPNVPMTPIEEQRPEDNDSSSEGGAKILLPISPAASQGGAHSQTKPSTVGKAAVEAGSSIQADLTLAVATVVTALMKSKEPGSCINTDLLAKIFSDPKKVEKLINEVGASSSSETEPVLKTKLSKTSNPLVSSKPDTIEEVCTENGALKETVLISRSNPGNAPREKTDENGAVVSKETGALKMTVTKSSVNPDTDPKKKTNDIRTVVDKRNGPLEKTVDDSSSNFDTEPREKTDENRVVVDKEKGALVDKSSPNPDSAPRKKTDENRAVIDKGNDALKKTMDISSLNPDTEPREKTDESRAFFDKEKSALVNTVNKSSSNPDTMPRITDENTAVTDKVNASFSNSDQVICELGPIDRGAASVPGPNYLSSHFTFLSQPDSVVHQSTSLPIMLMGASLPSLPSSKPDLDGLNWTNNGYGAPTKTNILPIPRPNLVTPEVIISKPNEDFVSLTRMKVCPLPKERQVELQLKAVLSDAVRPTDSQLISPLTAAPQVDTYVFPNQAQPGLQMTAPFLNQGQPSLQIVSPFQNQAQPMLGVNAPFLKPLEPPSLQMTGVAAVNAKQTFSLSNTGVPAQDKNYLKSLIRQHGEMQQAQDDNLSSHQQNTESVAYFDRNVLAKKIQRPCFFFSRPGGCSLGYLCPFVHDQPQTMQTGSVKDTHSSKRMKLDGEISGRHK